MKLTVNIQFHFNCDNLCQAWFQIYNFHNPCYLSPWLCIICWPKIDDSTTWLCSPPLGTRLALTARPPPPNIWSGPPGSRLSPHCFHSLGPNVRTGQWCHHHHHHCDISFSHANILYTHHDRVLYCIWGSGGDTNLGLTRFNSRNLINCWKYEI